MQGYAYILTHPGTPMVFWDHFYDWGHKSAIQALIKVRKDNGLHNKSTISIQKADGSGYAAIIDGKVAMKIGSGSWAPAGTGWTLRTSGTNYAVWDKSTTTTTGLRIHLYTGWTTPTMHYWNVQPAGATPNTTWPGVRMQSEGSGWWVYTIPNTSCANIIFSNNGANQTPDLSRCGEGWYMNGSWYSSKPGSTSRIANTETAADSEGKGLMLHQNYPNPASSTTNIPFSTPSKSTVRLVLYNDLGVAIQVLVNGEMDAGSHTVPLNTASLPKGIYVYRLEVENQVMHKKMVIIH